MHICCGPCATEVVRRLKADYEITGFFYNPNISPEEEFHKRLNSVRCISDQWQVRLEIGEYEHEKFLEAVQGMEHEPEGGRRCEVCYRLRLERTALKALDSGYQVIASTLTIGPNKKAGVINSIGRTVCAQHAIRFLEEDWKKKDGFKHSLELSHGLGLYRQNYCGCEFSMRENRSAVSD